MDELKQFVYDLIERYIQAKDHAYQLAPEFDKDALRAELRAQAAALLSQVEALIPVEDVCTMCNKPIEYVGPYWRHTGGYSPRHPATPKGEGS